MVPATNVYEINKNNEGKRYQPLTRYDCPVPGCDDYFYWKDTIPKHLAKVHKEVSK